MAKEVAIENFDYVKKYYWMLCENITGPAVCASCRAWRFYISWRCIVAHIPFCPSDFI